MGRTKRSTPAKKNPTPKESKRKKSDETVVIVTVGATTPTQTPVSEVETQSVTPSASVSVVANDENTNASTANVMIVETATAMTAAADKAAYEDTAESARREVRTKLVKAASTMLALVTLEASRVEDEMTAEIMLSLTERLERINDLLAKKNPLLQPILRKGFGDLVSQITLLYQKAGLDEIDAEKAALSAATSLVPNFDQK